jgi:hypothetical protein
VEPRKEEEEEEVFFLIIFLGLQSRVCTADCAEEGYNHCVDN